MDASVNKRFAYNEEIKFIMEINEKISQETSTWLCQLKTKLDRS